jgi:hypothetical protein
MACDIIFRQFKNGGCSSKAERHTVDVDVEGSKPSSLPENKPINGLFLNLDPE